MKPFKSMQAVEAELNRIKNIMTIKLKYKENFLTQEEGGNKFHTEQTYRTQISI
jgi:hypothetical protein